MILSKSNPFPSPPNGTLKNILKIVVEEKQWNLFGKECTAKKSQYGKSCWKDVLIVLRNWVHMGPLLLY